MARIWSENCYQATHQECDIERSIRMSFKYVSSYIKILFLELCVEGSQLMDWLRRHNLFQILFCRRRDDNCKGMPVRGSIEWLCYEEQRVFLSRFYSPQSVQRVDFYSKVFRRSVKELIGEC